jgi:hypothetical protein
MAEPWTFNFNPQDQTFTFSNEQVTFAVDTLFDPTQLPPESVTVESVTLTIPHEPTFVELGITSVEVPAPVIEHLSGHFDLLL